MMNLLRNAVDYYTDNGSIRTVGKSLEYLFSRAGQGAYESAIVTDKFIHPDYPIPVSHRLRALLYGFDVEEYLWLQLYDADPSSYFGKHRVPTGEWIKKNINGSYSEVLENKLLFHIITREYTDAVPDMHATIVNGTVYTDRVESITCSLDELLTNHDKIVLKPIYGSGGDNIYVITNNGRSDEMYVNGGRANVEDIKSFVSNLDGYLIGDYVKQHSLLQSIYSESTNTVRITCGNTANQPFIFSATQRFGSRQSAPTDNRSQGGFASPVDLETGELNSMIRLDGNGIRCSCEYHPETNQSVRGVELPYWERTCELAKMASRIHNQLDIVGWDIAITPNGPVLLEGNPNPRSILAQLDKGYFTDQRMKNIFKNTTKGTQQKSATTGSEEHSAISQL